MGISLQDQLVAAGLATAEQAARPQKTERVQRPGRKPRKHNAKPRREHARREPEPARAATRKEPEANIPTSISSTPKTFDWRRAKAQKLQANELIKKHKLNLPEAEVRHNFAKGNRVKQVYVTPAQRDEIIHGRLAIAIADDRPYIISLEVAARVRELSPRTFVLVNSADQPSGNDMDYQGFEIPDDLMW